MKVSMQSLCTCTHVHSILARNRHKKVHVHVEKKRQCIMYTCTQPQWLRKHCVHQIEPLILKGGCYTECYTFSCSQIERIIIQVMYVQN